MTILLVYAGGEVTLHRYKKPMPDQAISHKMSALASVCFQSWEWEECDFPAIQDLNSGAMILAVRPQGEECFL